MKRFLALLLSLLIAVPFAPTPAWAATYGEANEPCETVGTALTTADNLKTEVEAAANGTTFLLGAGTYVHGVIVPTATNLTIKPNNCAVVIGTGSWQLNGSPDGLTLAGFKGDGTDQASYVVTTGNGTNNVTIRNMTLRGGNLSAIRGQHTLSDWLIEGNDIDNNDGPTCTGTTTVDFGGTTVGVVKTNITVRGNKLQEHVCEDPSQFNQWAGLLLIEYNWLPGPTNANHIDVKSPALSTGDLIVRGNYSQNRGLANGANLLIQGNATVPTWPVGVTCLVEDNVIEDGFRTFRIGDTGQAQPGPQNCTIRNNTLRGTQADVELLRLSNVGNIVHNNTFYKGEIEFHSSGSNQTFKNNLCSACVYAMPAAEVLACSNNVNFNSTGTFPAVCTSTQTGDPNLSNPDAGNLTLTAGSSAIGNGVAIAGLTCNGACDIGRYQSPKATSCVVENATPSRIDVTFTNNSKPPIQTGAVTGITIQVAAGDRVESVPTVNGTNIIQYTIDGVAVSNGQAVTWAAASTNTVTDSSAVGEQPTDQSLLATGTIACTNNVGEAQSYNFVTTAFQFYRLRTTSGSLIIHPHAAAAVNTNISLPLGGAFVLDIQIDGTLADPPAIGAILRYSKNAGAYTVIPDAFDADNIAFYGTDDSSSDIITQGTATTSCLSGALTVVNGLTIRTSNAIPTFDQTQDDCTVLRFILKIDTDATLVDTYDFRPYNQNGDALDTYTVTPRITVIDYIAGSGM